MPDTLTPLPPHPGLQVAIAVARFNEDISQRLLDGAIETLVLNGILADHITVAWVPGSFELPLLCDAWARQGNHAGIIALGCVIRGETSHYDYVCEAAASGILQTGLRHELPVIFGVLTTENREQAILLEFT